MRAFLFFFTGKRKESGKAHGTSRGEGFLETTLGTMKDDLVGALGVTADKDGYIDSEGNYHQRTCFTRGTKIKVLDSEKSSIKTIQKNIEEIQIGDYALSWNEKTGVMSYNKVTKLFKSIVTLLFVINLSTGSKIEATWNHPFYVEGDSFDSSFHWVEAKNLKPGDKFIQSNGQTITVVSIAEKKVIPTEVFNFEVEENHTYFVGEDGILVHNQNNSYFTPPITGLPQAGLLDNLANKVIDATHEFLSNNPRLDATLRAAPFGIGAATNTIHAIGEMNNGNLLQAQENLTNAASQAASEVTGLRGGKVNKVQPKMIGPAGDPGGVVTSQIPSTWKMEPATKPGGTRFYDPQNRTGNNVRVMQGNPNSPNPAQQTPYVKWVKDGKPRDVSGRPLPNGDVEEAHIPRNQFRMR